MASDIPTSTQTQAESTTAVTQQPRKKKKNNSFLMRMGILGELLGFLWRRKLYWLIPMMITLLLFAVIIVIGSSGPGGVFIYTLWG